MELPISLKKNKQGIERTIPSVMNLDQVVIPAGWDSRGKILTLRDGFNIELVLKFWENDTKIDEENDDIKSLKGVTSSENEEDNRKIQEDIKPNIGENKSLVYEDTAVGDSDIMDINNSPTQLSRPSPSKPKRPSDTTIKTKTKENAAESESNKTNIESAVKYFEYEIINLHPEEEEVEEDEEEESKRETNENGRDETSHHKSDKQRDYRKTREKKTDFQEFMKKQYDVLESKIRQEEESAPPAHQLPGITGTPSFRRARGYMGNNPMNTPGQQHNDQFNSERQDLVPSQEYYNIGGIQVESGDEVFRRLKIQEAANHVQPEMLSPFSDGSATPGVSPYIGSDTDGIESGLRSGPGTGKGTGPGSLAIGGLGVAGLGLTGGKIGIGNINTGSGYLDSPTMVGRHGSNSRDHRKSSPLPQQPYTPLGKPKTFIGGELGLGNSGTRTVSLSSSPLNSSISSPNPNQATISSPSSSRTNSNKFPTSDNNNTENKRSVKGVNDSGVSDQKVANFFQSILERN